MTPARQATSQVPASRGRWGSGYVRGRPTATARSVWPTRLRVLLLLAVLGLLVAALPRLVYPLLYRHSLVQHACRERVAPSLVAAVVWSESRFRPWARSPVGARGLMQVMPQTATWVVEHQQMGVESPEERLLEPDFNLQVGTAYLGHLSRRFPGDPVAVLAAYNAGPENVEIWRAGEERLRPERIGFAETRWYVRSVLRCQARYRQIYPELDRPGASEGAQMEGDSDG